MNYYLIILLPLFWLLSSFFGRLITYKSTILGRGVAIIAGTVFIVSLMACVYSSGKTILCPVFLFFTIVLLINRKFNFRTVAKECLRDMMNLTLFSWLLIGVTWSVLGELGNGKVLSGDYIFYGKLGKFFIDSGIETKDLNYFKWPSGTEVYHYFDIWLCGLVKKAANLNIGQAVFVTYFILFTSVLWYLIIDLINVFLKIRFHHVLGVLSLIVLLGLSGTTYLFDSVIHVSEYGDFNGFMNPKLILIYIIIICLFFAIWQKDNWMIVSIALVSIFIYATIIPAMMGVVAVFFILNYKQKVFEKKQLFPILLLTLGCVVFGIFYLTFNSGYDSNELFPEGTISKLKVRVNIFGKTSIYILLGLMPLIIILFLNRKKNDFPLFRNVLIVFLGGVFSGLLAWALLCSKTDSVQIWSNFYYPVVGCIYMFFCIGFFRGWYLVVLLFFISIDFFYPALNQSMVVKVYYKDYDFTSFNGRNVGFLNYYAPGLNVYSSNDKIYFGNLKGLATYSNARIISLSMNEVPVLDAHIESIVRSSNLYSIRKFDLNDTMNRLSFQRQMINKLHLDYVFIHRKRSKKSRNDLLGPYWKKMDSPEPDYELYKNMKR